MRKFMHRTVSKEAEIDPMNAPTRTVFFERTKSDKVNQYGKSSSDENDDEDVKKTTSYKKQVKPFRKSLEKFTDSKISDEKVKEISKQIELEKISHSKVKKRLELKSESVKKAKSTLVETQKKMDDVMKNGKQEFEQSKLEMIGEMSSKMAHDIRNPLSVLHCHVQLMQLKQQKETDENVTFSLIKMEEAISTITNQINDVMDFIKTPQFHFACCNLKSLLIKIIDSISIPKDVELDLFLESHIIKCDIIKVKAAISNIIQNSIQAINSKGQITITIKDVDTKVEIIISDSGKGIPEENLEKIFEPMFTTKSLGTGLGLASCKELFEMHNGTISVKNNPTTFTITIPKHEPE
jgi:signal transduction histidine kinase